jgi:hypothetical protein
MPVMAGERHRTIGTPIRWVAFDAAGREPWHEMA